MRKIVILDSSQKNKSLEAHGRPELGMGQVNRMNSTWARKLLCFICLLFKYLCRGILYLVHVVQWRKGVRVFLHSS